MRARGVWVELSGGNVRNNHIPLGEIVDFFPPDSLGGANKAAAARDIYVKFATGDWIETDIDKTKWILRERSAVRSFFQAFGARIGSRILISKEGERHFRFELANS